MPDNEGQVVSETKSLNPIGTTDEQHVELPELGKDQNDSLASADDLIESLRSGSYWSQGIRVDQEDRERVVNSSVFKDSLAIRAGEIAPEPTGHGLPLSKCEAYNRVYDQRSRSS
jgi:hypothetical protein